MSDGCSPSACDASAAATLHLASSGTLIPPSQIKKEPLPPNSRKSKSNSAGKKVPPSSPIWEWSTDGVGFVNKSTKSKHHKRRTAADKEDAFKQPTQPICMLLPSMKGKSTSVPASKDSIGDFPAARAGIGPSTPTRDEEPETLECAVIAPTSPGITRCSGCKAPWFPTMPGSQPVRYCKFFAGSAAMIYSKTCWEIKPSLPPLLLKLSHRLWSSRSQNLSLMTT